MPSGFLAPKELSCLAFKSDDYELTWWRLLQERVVRTKFDILGGKGVFYDMEEYLQSITPIEQKAIFK